jgi:hypothetical protein
MWRVLAAYGRHQNIPSAIQYGALSHWQSKALSLMLDELSKMDGNLQTIIVQYVKPSAA